MVAVTEGRVMRDPEFEEFVGSVERPLRHALVARYGEERGREAAAEALAYAWLHRDRVLAMERPIGYLFRVGQSRSRLRRHGFLRRSGQTVLPEVEPGLGRALARLSDRQRTVVILHYCMEWSLGEIGERLDLSRSSIQRHLERGTDRLRQHLGVDRERTVAKLTDP